jgi:hypothetical protein
MRRDKEAVYGPNGPSYGALGYFRWPREKWAESTIAPAGAVRTRALASVSSIAVCSDIGPLLLAKSGVGVSGILKPPALCLKANAAGVVQLH